MNPSCPRHWGIVASLLLFGTGCNPGPSFECKPRTLETEEFSRELFTGTWSNCPYHPIDYLEHESVPEEIYCTFHDDGSLTLREQHSSGFSRDTTTTWDVNVDQQELIQYDEDGDSLECFHQIEINQGSLRVVGVNTGPGEWEAMRCGGPDW